ncbi:hypothetical protein VDG1235_1823 [Verrucomicrobiia bacterium DG1235]|nr:hypothetical protein VDG1235_1823 [Verrucomicrobiae bacterium DG1235]
MKQLSNLNLRISIMRLRNICSTLAKTVLCAAAPLFLPTLLLAQEEKTPDPWFTEDRKAPEIEEAQTPDQDAPTAILRKTKPATIAKRLRKSLDLIPEGNLSKRIDLLEEIVSTAKSSPEDLSLLARLKTTKQDAINAIDSASATSHSILDSIENIGAYSNYFNSDPSLLVYLLESDFSQRLSAHVSSLSRRGKGAELAILQSEINNSGLKNIFGYRIKTSVIDATSGMIARRWDELSLNATTLPGEAYLLGRLLEQNDKKLALAIELPPNADPKLTSNIGRSIESAWGKAFKLVDQQARAKQPEFILKIDANRIQSTHTSSEKTVESVIPGAIVEEPNPDFLDLVARYEKAASIYENAVKSYEARYQQYLDSMDDTEYRNAQASLKQAESNLKATPPPTGPGSSPEYDAARAQFQTAQALAFSISAPSAIQPSEPVPYHLDILEELYLVPSTLISSEDKTPYEYVEKSLSYIFESRAPITLESPASEKVAAESLVTFTQNRAWTKTLGANPRDPTADEGTYSESAYNSALDIFGLEFSSHCARELGSLFEKAKTSLQTQQNDLPQTLLYLALKAATSGSDQLAINEAELKSLAELAQKPNLSSSQFRARCIALILAKTEFSNLADEEQIAQFL